MACAAKSNAVYVAMKRAMSEARSSGSAEVPLHLRNATTRLMEAEGSVKVIATLMMSRMRLQRERIIFPMSCRHSVFTSRRTGLESRIREKLERLRVSTRRQRPVKPSVAGSEFELSVGVSRPYPVISTMISA